MADYSALPAGLQMFDLTGRVALVSGAGRGLGRDLALGLARCGARLAVTARSKDELARLADELHSEGRVCSVHPADVTDTRRIPELVDAVMAEHGQLDILINNAGTKVVRDAVDVTEEDWDRVLNVNLKAAFFLAQAAGRHMLECGHGKIVNIASTYSVVAGPGRVSYAASKGGLLQLTRTLSAEWAARGINVNAIGPTSMETPLNAALFADPEWRDKALAKIPAHRFATPADVAGAVIFLASSAADMVHGQLLMIDGGLTVV